MTNYLTLNYNFSSFLSFLQGTDQGYLYLDDSFGTESEYLVINISTMSIAVGYMGFSAIQLSNWSYVSYGYIGYLVFNPQINNYFYNQLPVSQFLYDNQNPQVIWGFYNPNFTSVNHKFPACYAVQINMAYSTISTYSFKECPCVFGAYDFNVEDVSLDEFGNIYATYQCENVYILENYNQVYSWPLTSGINMIFSKLLKPNNWNCYHSKGNT
jgi:hypothetical protein